MVGVADVDGAVDGIDGEGEITAPGDHGRDVRFGDCRRIVQLESSNAPVRPDESGLHDDGRVGVDESIQFHPAQRKMVLQGQSPVVEEGIGGQVVVETLGDAAERTQLPELLTVGVAEVPDDGAHDERYVVVELDVPVLARRTIAQAHAAHSSVEPECGAVGGVDGQTQDASPRAEQAFHRFGEQKTRGHGAPVSRRDEEHVGEALVLGDGSPTVAAENAEGSDDLFSVDRDEERLHAPLPDLKSELVAGDSPFHWVGTVLVRIEQSCNGFCVDLLEGPYGDGHGGSVS